jgi:hypothetical protein
MHTEVTYSPIERVMLCGVAAFGFFAVNGAFLYGLLFDPGAMRAALTNPIAAAFISETLVLTAMFAHLFGKWKVVRISWRWFVALSLLGSLAFSIPIAVLYRTVRPPAH